MIAPASTRRLRTLYSTLGRLPPQSNPPGGQGFPIEPVAHGGYRLHEGMASLGDRAMVGTSTVIGARCGALARLSRALLFGVLATGCTNTVVPPPPADEQAAVFLLDHGQHASLVLERAPGVARYTYGEWGYYVEGRKGLARASGTLLGTNEAGIGRRALPAPPSLAAIRRHLRVRVEYAWRIDVPASRAARLGRRLDALFVDNTASRTYNARYDLTFVHHPAPYHMGNNSNHMTARWLRALGCEVTLTTPFSVWSVRDAPAAGETAGPRRVTLSGAASTPARPATPPRPGRRP